jgi:hypothetical protein
MKFAVALMLCFCSFSAYAQNSDPINAGRILYRKQAGVIIGTGLIAQSGNFNVTCDCPAFEGGRGTGLVAGAIYEDDLLENFVWGGALLFQTRPIEALYRQTELVTVESSASNREFTIPAEFRNSASADFSYLTFMPFVKYIQLHPLFIRVGAGLSTVVSGRIVHTKELLTTTVLSAEGTVENVQLVDENKNPIDNPATVEDGNFAQLNSFQFSIEPAIGVDIRLGKSDWFIAPVVQYSLPLMTISENGQDFKLSALQFMAEVRVVF